MRPDKVIVSGETVVELAKCALVPIRCDAPVPVGPDDKRTYPCSQELSCWKTHFKHSVKKHSSKRKAHNGVIHYQCGLNKCSAKLHSSSKALKAHIETSHMKTFPLPCPFANCTPPRLDFGRPEKYYMFMRERDLVSHLKTEHSHLIGCELDVRDSEILLPSWEPRPPARPLPAPPDLPFGSVSVAALRLAEIKPRSIRSWGWLIRAQAEADAETEDMNANTDTPSPRCPRPSPSPSPSRKRLPPGLPPAAAGCSACLPSVPRQTPPTITPTWNTNLTTSPR
ncbi:hypothetical protein B0H11DRAFT_1020219 [Mycena galericulata]|nr:hypothetical protein B0H11DRAFT_1020219 [Mycena galericulata]